MDTARPAGRDVGMESGTGAGESDADALRRKNLMKENVTDDDGGNYPQQIGHESGP
jgi:hypothetical protein